MAQTSVKTPAEKALEPLSAMRWPLLLVSLPFGILDFVLPIYGKQVGASAVEIGLLFSTFSFMSILLRPVIGAGLDRFGRRWFFIAGLAGYALSMAVFANAADIWGLVTARVIQGAASALLWLAASAIVADLASSDQRGQRFGAISQATSQGGIIGTFIGFTVLVPAGTEIGWNPLFLGYTFGSLVAAFIAWRQMPETRPAVTEPEVHPLEPLRKLLRSRPMILLMLVTAVTAASWSMVSPILMIYLQEKMQAEISQLAWAFLPSALVWAVLPTRLGRLADRFGRKPLMVLGMVVASLTSFLIPSLQSMLGLTVLWTVQAICYAAGDPAEQALVADLTGSDQRGRAYGLYALAGGIGATVGPLAGGWLYDNAGQSASFIANGVVLAVCAVILWVFLKEKS